MHCDHVDKKLSDQLTQQFLHHHIHLKHQMTSKRLHHFSKAVDSSCVTNSCSRKTTFVSLRCKASCRIGSSCSRQMCWFLASLVQCHKTVTWKPHRLRMTMRHGSTPAIARNLERCGFLASLVQCHKTVTWKSHRLRMTMRHGSTPAIARNLEIEWTSNTTTCKQ